LSNVVSVLSFQDASLKPDSRPLTGFEQKFCIAVQESDKALLARLNEGLSIVIASGTYEELYDKWFGPILPKPSVSLVMLVKYLLFILVPVLAFLGIFGLRYLHREVDRKTRKLSEQILVRQAAEASLVQMRDTLQAILKAAPAGVIVADGTGRILHASQFADQFFGGAVIGNIHESEGMYTLSKFDGSPVAADSLPLSLSLEGKAVFDTELLVTRADGTQSVILANATPLRNNENVIWGAVTVFQDITEIKEAQQEREHLI
jgi:PAS domain-containing protein